MSILVGRAVWKLHHNASCRAHYLFMQHEKCAFPMWRSVQTTSQSMKILYTRTPNILSEIRCFQCASKRCATKFTRMPRKFKPMYSKDGVSRDYELIYENNMRTYYKVYPMIVYSTVLPALCIGVFIGWYYLNEKWENINLEHPVMLAIPGMVFGSILCLLCVFISKRNVIRMYLHPENGQGIAIVPNNVLWTKQLAFKMEDCSRIPPSAIFRYIRGNLRMKHRSFIVVATDFVVPKYYNDMMGWLDDDDVEADDVDVSKFIRKK